MGRPVRLQTHSLLRIDSVAELLSATLLPGWVTEALLRAPWVVVRRAPLQDGLLPVGVRGAARAARFAAWLPPGRVLDCLTPLQLAARHDWRGHPRSRQFSALAAMAGVGSIMARASLDARWGPSGSVAFELASGCATVTSASDLDLIVQADDRLPPAAARELLEELAQLPARADVLLETPGGGVALREFARARTPFLARTPEGPRLLHDPWAGAAAAA